MSLTITETGGADQWWAIWGIRSPLLLEFG